GSGRVELYVGPPVLQSLARLLDLLVGKGQVVVSVSIGGRQLESRQVGANCVFHATGLVENIAQIKVRQGIAGVQLNGASIVLLGGFVILAVVVQGAEIDVGGGVFGVEFEHPLVNRNRLELVAGVFFQSDAARKQLCDIPGDRRGGRRR